MVLNVNVVVNDLFLGKPVKYSFSFTFEATILTSFSELYRFSWTDSNHLSSNEFSLPPILVPLIVLILASIPVRPPSLPEGVNTLNLGTIAL